MPIPYWRNALLVPICLVAGCASMGSNPSTEAKASQRASTTAPARQRQMLNEGYSMLYADAGKLDMSELILYVKVESESFEGTVTAVAQYGNELKKQLEQLAKDYPAVRIDLDPLPEIEKRKRMAIAKDRARYFAPVVGQGGVEYERTVLIGYLNGINHERHLCQVMAEAEPNANLKNFLLDTEKRYDALYNRVDSLLNKHYFKGSGKVSRD